VADLERIFDAYESGLRELNEELLAGIDLAPDDRDHLMLLRRLVEGLVRSYAAYHLGRAASLDASKSVMYAASDGHSAARVLDVSLRSLVEQRTLTTWQARYIHGCLTAKRTILVTGPKGVGKSTLLNAVIQLIAVDQRIIAIQENPELPAIRSRSFTVQLSAKPGTPAFATALHKAVGMKPTWILAGDLVSSDGPDFLQSLTQGAFGLATLITPDPEVSFTDWVITSPTAGPDLRAATPLVVHMHRDSGGRPRVLRLMDITADESGHVRVTERREG
jgi:Flp pilus assembly CpaF family ATPase